MNLLPVEKLDSSLLQVFETAAFLAESEGKDYVSTTTFVTALVFHNPGRISEIFQKLPPSSLPSPPQDIGQAGSESLDKLKSLSPCIQSAMNNLIPKVDGEVNRKLSSEDVFVDFARYSGGKWTRCLRSHGITKQSIDLLIDELGWELIERDVPHLD